MLKTANEVIAHGDVRAVVDFAVEVNREIAANTKELNTAKAHLRADARKSVCSFMGVALRDKAPQPDGSVDIEGNLGTATVVFDKDTPKIRKGQTLKDIEPNLPEETFASLFTREVVVRPVKDFVDRLGDLSAAEREVIDRFLEVKPTTPKVYLPK